MWQVYVWQNIFVRAIFDSGKKIKNLLPQANLSNVLKKEQIHSSE